MERQADTLWKVLDQHTGENVTYNKVTAYHDGSAMNDAACDGVIYRKVTTAGTTEYFRRNTKGTYNAAWFGIVGDGTDQTARLNTVLAMSHVRHLEFSSIDQKNITVSGAVTVPVGKQLVMYNQNQFIGSGSINFQGARIDCSLFDQCFGTTLSVTNLGNMLISVRWFGAKADFKDDGTSGTWTDNHPIFQKALASRLDVLPSVNFNYYAKMYVPVSDVPNRWYAFNDTFILDGAIEFFGDGIERTILKFPSNKKGIWLRYPDYAGGFTYKGGRSQYLHDFDIVGTTSTYGSAPFDGSSHGIYVQTNLAIIERVASRRFNGHGICIQANNPNSNANNCLIKECQGKNCSGSGIYFDGADGNQVKAEGGDYSYNARWGYHDGSFLGCMGIGVHVAANSTENIYNRTYVSHLGNQYYCIKDVIYQVSHNGNRYRCIVAHNKPTTIAVTEPGVGSSWATYWTLVGPGGPDQHYLDWNIDTWQDFTTGAVQPTVTSNWQAYWEFLRVGGYDADTDVNINAGVVKKWTADTMWYTGGGYFLEDGNAVGALFGCYSEGDQHLLTNTSQSMVLGGFASNYGSYPGAIGVQQGILTCMSMKFMQPGSKRGFRIQQDEASLQTQAMFFNELNGHSMGWIYDNNLRTIFSTEMQVNAPIMEMVTGGALQSVYAARYGLNYIPQAGTIGFPLGIFLGRNQDDFTKRYFGGGTQAPTSQEWAEGSIIINDDPNNSAVKYWKCIASGTPGTWVAIGNSEYALAYAANIDIDARLSDLFHIPLNGNTHMNAPSHLCPGQEIYLRFKQDATGSRTVTWDAIYRFSDYDIPDGIVLSTGAGYTDYFKFKYNNVDHTLDCIGIEMGYAPTT